MVWLHCLQRTIRLNLLTAGGSIVVFLEMRLEVVLLTTLAVDLRPLPLPFPRREVALAAAAAAAALGFPI